MFLDRPVAAGPGVARATATRIGLAVLVAGTAVIAAGAAGGPSYRVVPAGRHGLPGWVAGPLHGLGVTLAPRTLGIVFLAMCAAYVAVVASGATLPVRPTIAAIVGVHLVILVAPPLLSRDVFNYLEYGRVFALHGLDPYGHGAGVVPHDAAHPFICCPSSPDPYGPGFTLVAAALAKLSLPTGF